MVEQVRVSVAMVTYNGEKYIRQQLDSVLQQLTEQDEVVVSDDGSGDGTIAVLEEYQNRDRRVRVVKGPRSGIKKNVEHALRQCRGDIIFLADQDDIWKSNKVERVLAVMDQEKCMLVIHDAEVFQEDPEQITMQSFFAFRNAGPGVIKNMIKNSYIGCCMTFRRELLEKALPIPSGLEMHDQWIGILSDFYFGRSVFLKEPLLSYRRHGDNNSAMGHYGIGKMIRNRVVLGISFLGRILSVGRKRDI